MQDNFKRILLKKRDSIDLEDQMEFPSPKQGHKSEEKQTKSQKFKLKVNNTLQANSVEKQEDMENERRQEILMDSQPRLRIFRFKHIKTCLDENQKEKIYSRSKGAKISKSNEMLEKDKDDGSRNRAASKKAASRYEQNAYNSDSFEQRSNTHLDKELNSISRHHQHSSASPRADVGSNVVMIQSNEKSSSLENQTRNIVNQMYLGTDDRNSLGLRVKQSNEKSHKSVNPFKVEEEDIEDILSNSQISRVHHRFNLKRFSAAMFQSKPQEPLSQRADAQPRNNTSISEYNITSQKKLKSKKEEFKSTSSQKHNTKFQIFSKSKSPPPPNLRAKKNISQTAFPKEQYNTAAAVSKMNFKLIQKNATSPNSKDLKSLRNQKTNSTQTRKTAKKANSNSKEKQTEIQTFIKEIADGTADKDIQKNLTNRIKEINPSTKMATGATLKQSNLKHTQSNQAKHASTAHSGSGAKTSDPFDLKHQLNQIQEEISQIDMIKPPKKDQKAAPSKQKRKQPIASSTTKKLSSGKIPKLMSDMMTNQKKTKNDEAMAKTQTINQIKQLRNEFDKKILQVSARNSSSKQVAAPKKEGTAIQHSRAIKHQNSMQQISIGLVDMATAKGTILTGSLTHTSSMAGRTNTNSSASGNQKNDQQDATTMAPIKQQLATSSNYGGSRSPESNQQNKKNSISSRVHGANAAYNPSKNAIGNPVQKSSYYGAKLQQSNSQKAQDKTLVGPVRLGSSSSASGIASMSRLSHQKPSICSHQSSKQPVMQHSNFRSHKSNKAICQTATGFISNAHLQPPLDQPPNDTKQLLAYPSSQATRVQQSSKKSVRGGSGDANSQRQRNRNFEVQKSNRSQSQLSSSVSKAKRKQGTSKPAAQQLVAGQQGTPNKQPDASMNTGGAPSSASQLGNILCNTKEAILQQKICTKLESTKKIILKNQEQMLNKQQQIIKQSQIKFSKSNLCGPRPTCHLAHKMRKEVMGTPLSCTSEELLDRNQ